MGKEKRYRTMFVKEPKALVSVVSG